MINVSSSALKIRVILPPVDMRKSFNGLTATLREYSIANFNPQFLYVFSNKRRNRVKILYFDRTGIYVIAKKLEQGTFSWPTPRQADETVLRLSPEALQLLLDGVDLRGPKKYMIGQ